MEQEKVIYQKLSKEVEERITRDRDQHVVNPYACLDSAVVRRDASRDKASLWRPAYARDIDKIMNIPYYNRYADKTQVFSFVKNDDVSRRFYHVQLVAKIARTIGRLLNLNLDLIEAAALGHDIGHTPLGHAGERLLNEKYREHTGRYFNHNVHSVRVLDTLAGWNISLQTLDGVLCHNGELEQKEYRPKKTLTFDLLDREVDLCNTNQDYIKQLVPGTLEGCVVRVSDIIAYLGKDRQDAIRLGVLNDESSFTGSKIGSSNPYIINNMIVNIVENSYGKDYLQMDDVYFEEFSNAKKENYKWIYRQDGMEEQFEEHVVPMFHEMYEEILKQAKELRTDSIFYKHHIAFLKEMNQFNPAFDIDCYLQTEPNLMTVDYIASMTDDYFVDLHHELFPKSRHKIVYKGYFDV
jgi:dGTPase